MHFWLVLTLTALTISVGNQSSVLGASIEIKHLGLNLPANDDRPGTHIPESNGLLNFYALPIGQGDSQIVQCPNGDLTIMDLGAGAGGNSGYWGATEITYFLLGDFYRIRNVVVTHNHADHFSMLGSVLTRENGLTGLQNIYLSCTFEGANINVRNWVQSIEGEDNVRTFNGGLACGPSGVPCGEVDLCPGDPDIKATIMAANMANCNPQFNFNLDSIIVKVVYRDVSIMFNGDFEDATTDQDENGVQKAVVDYYGDELKVTVYKMARHGLATFANKRISLNAHAPKAIFASADPTNFAFGPISCWPIDYLTDVLSSLCKPLVTDPASPYFCGPRPDDRIDPEQIVQRNYSCDTRFVEDNEFAIYSTIPHSTLLNVVRFQTDGVNWGFVNNFFHI